MSILPKKFLLMPSEVIAIFFWCFVLLAYLYFELPMPGEPGKRGVHGLIFFYLGQVLTSLDMYVLILLLILAAGIVKKVKAAQGSRRTAAREALLEWLQRFEVTTLFQDLRFMNAILMMLIQFSLMKHLIPHINSAVFDSWVYDAEAYLCGGDPCGLILIRLLGTNLASYVSTHYLWYFPYMTILIFTFIAIRDRALTQEFTTALMLIFLLGILAVYAFPTWGPIYYAPEKFDLIAGTEVHGLQRGLWQMKLQLERNPLDRTAIFMISGIPSLHVAVLLLGTLYLRRLSVWLAVLSAVMLLLTINSTLYLGWHYVIDDILAVPLVIVAVTASRRFTWNWS